jgi:alpha-tubulin suppressor-like RCC1 family protein
VSVGRGYTCGLTTEDLAYCWGSNFAGALGDGTTRDHEVPEPVVGPI